MELKLISLWTTDAQAMSCNIAIKREQATNFSAGSGAIKGMELGGVEVNRTCKVNRIRNADILDCILLFRAFMKASNLTS